jgi:hypothetical protein
MFQAAVESNIARSRFDRHVRVLAIFLACGFFSGLSFSWLTTREGLQRFWFFKTDKFLIPRLSYWIAFGLIIVLGWAAGYFGCRSRNWLSFSPRQSKRRLFASVTLITASAPLLYLLTPVMNELFGLTWDFLVAPIAFIILISVSLCVFTDALRLLPLAFLWNLLFIVVAFVIVYLVVRSLSNARDWYEFVEWPVIEAMLALSFGSWVIWCRGRFVKAQRIGSYSADD